MTLAQLIHEIDVEASAKAFQDRRFPHIVFDNFLKQDFAEQIYASLPTYEEAERVGKKFRKINENKKVQVRDSETFPGPVQTLKRLLASTETTFLLSQITGIQNLLSDEELVGGGLHYMPAGAHLDVHIDFNLIRDRGLYRRLNLLLFLNKDWSLDWNGSLELWNEDVTSVLESIPPVFNRCAIFATTENSYHGVTKVKCPDDECRRSFAAYYYTDIASSGEIEFHSTVFRARPNERIKKYILMPAAGVIKRSRRWRRGLKARIFGRPSKPNNPSA